MNIVNNQYPLPYDCLMEFISDARAKHETILEYELGYITTQNKYEKIRSSGLVLLKHSAKDCITIRDQNSTFDIVISPIEDKDNISEYFFDNISELCLVKFIDRRIEYMISRAIISNLTLGLKDGVCISTDLNWTDWTGYLGEIIIDDE